MTNEPVTTDHHKLVQETAREFARKQLAPRAKEIDEAETLPADLFPALGKLGLLGLPIPEKYGGSEAGFFGSAVALEELAQASAGLTLSVGAHSFLCAHNLYARANEAQREKYLPKLCSGEWIGAFALTEPEAGSDAAGLKTTARKKGDRFILNGSKIFITNGSIAQVFIVFARTERVRGSGPISAFIVEKGFKGFSLGKDMEKLGTRGSPLSELIFTDCEVPEQNLLGEQGQGLAYMLGGLDMERSVFPMMAVGTAQAAFDYALNYAMKRRQFGKPISSFQLVQEMLAQMATDIEAARLLTYQACRRLDEGLPVTKQASFAKLFAAQMCMRVTQQAVQILGGYGFTTECPVERFYRDAALVGIGGGTSQVQQLIIARELMKEKMAAHE